MLLPIPKVVMKRKWRDNCGAGDWYNVEAYNEMIFMQMR